MSFDKINAILSKVLNAIIRKKRKQDRRSCVEILETFDVDVAVNLLAYGGPRLNITPVECSIFMQELKYVSATGTVPPNPLMQYVFSNCRTENSVTCTANFYLKMFSVKKGSYVCTSSTLAYTYRHFRR